ncbi:type VI secretion system baseplate subunit TssF [Massilia sp. S19_KUP03_FR1]|uniref:type VI secretion system baseplate subunit TssF n=1 Tax=Massilia sp. S19_KUP03_FR1 TaxID=3025503 RepID=UPI002FCDA7D1
MDSTLLRYYERELQHLREMGGEFARDFPKVAGRLGLESYACADPYVERLLEGFSFLAARVQLKIDAEFPRFTNHLLEQVYPHYLAPTPSMAIVQLQPDLSEGSLAAGFTVARQSSLRSLLGKGDQTTCEYRSAHAVTLWPIELTEARYFPCAGKLGKLELSRFGAVKAALRLRLRVGAGLAMRDLALDALQLHLRGGDALPARILEQLLSSAVGTVVMPLQESAGWHSAAPPGSICARGFDDDDALLPGVSRAFRGYRLLQEYFAFPQRYLFVDLHGLGAGLRRCPDQEVDIVVLFDRFDAVLEQTLGADNFGLFCTPAINLFPKRADRIHLSDRQHEYHVVPDRTRPMDFEVYQVGMVTGYGAGNDAGQPFAPFHSANDLHGVAPERAYYQLRRAQRVLSERQRREGPRSSYIGSEAFIALVDAHEAPFASSLRQLGVDTLCTNRDLPLAMPLGGSRTDFTLESNAPVKAVRCIDGPSVPAPSHAEGETAWRLVSHLSLNYLSLLDDDRQHGAAALKDLLRLYCVSGDAAGQRQIDALRAVASSAVARRLPSPGPICFGRGLQITLDIDDAPFEGIGVFVLGAVLEQFFAKYVSINSFTETRLRTPRRGVVMQWPPRGGACKIL